MVPVAEAARAHLRGVNFPWTEHELHDTLCSHLDWRRANLARYHVGRGYLEWGAFEVDPLTQKVTVDVVIKVGRDDDPATMHRRAAGWSTGKYTHGQEIRIRTEAALGEILDGWKDKVELRSVQFVQVPERELEELAARRAALRDPPATNQANVHPASPAKIERLGLRFRSYAEVDVWEALLANLGGDESASPLPVVATSDFDRIEPDFLVFTPSGHALIEVDGPTHDEGARAAAKRTATLEAAGFKVFRASVSEVSTPGRPVCGCGGS